MREEVKIAVLEKLAQWSVSPDKYTPKGLVDAAMAANKRNVQTAVDARMTELRGGAPKPTGGAATGKQSLQSASPAVTKAPNLSLKPTGDVIGRGMGGSTTSARRAFAEAKNGTDTEKRGL